MDGSKKIFKKNSWICHGKYNYELFSFATNKRKFYCDCTRPFTRNFCSIQSFQRLKKFYKFFFFVTTRNIKTVIKFMAFFTILPVTIRYILVNAKL